MCAKDDVLWSHAENVKKHRNDVPLIEINGANFSLDRDAEGTLCFTIVPYYTLLAMRL